MKLNERQSGRGLPVTGRAALSLVLQTAALGESFHARRYNLLELYICRRVGVKAFNAPGTDFSMGTEAHLPARVARLGAIVIREIASRPKKAERTGSDWQSAVKKKPAEPSQELHAGKEFAARSPFDSGTV